MQANTSPVAFPFPFDAAAHCADTALAGIERLARLEMQLAWDWVALGREQAAALLADGSAEREGWPLLERGSQAALRFNRECLATAQRRQTELARLAAEQTAALQRGWRSADLEARS